MRIGEVLGLRFYAKLSFPPNSVALGIAGFSVLGIKKIESKGIVLGNSLQGVHAYYGHDVALPMLERSVRSVLIFIFIFYSRINMVSSCITDRSFLHYHSLVCWLKYYKRGWLILDKFWMIQLNISILYASLCK